MDNNEYAELAEAVRRKIHPTSAYVPLGAALAKAVVAALEKAAEEEKNENH